MPDYTHTTRGQAIAALAAKLGDPLHAFWPATEKVAALNEALRIFNAATGHDRARGSFQTIDGVVLYQLPALLQDATSILLRQQTLHDTDIVPEVKQQLMESAQATDQFTLAQIVGALQRARDQFIADTGIVISDIAIPVDAASNGYIDLPSDAIAIRRAVWHAGNGRYTTLGPSDERMALASTSHFLTRSTPRSYIQTATAPLELRLIPAPAYSGTLELLLLRNGAPFDPTQVASILLGIPDDYAWVPKYRAIATLMLDDESFDPERAELADNLYHFGCALAIEEKVILNAEIDGTVTRPGALHLLDRTRNGWQGREHKRPDTLVIASPDAVLLADTPDGPHSVTLDVVRNMRIPADDSKFVQVPAEQLDTIYLLAQWICLFKNRGETGAKQMFEQAMTGVKSYSDRRRGSSKAFDSILSTASAESRAFPVEQLPLQSSAISADVRAERNARRRERRLPS